jgi:hypothetical protein
MWVERGAPAYGATMNVEQATHRVRAAAARVDEALEAVAAAKQALHREALKALVAVDGDEVQRDLVHRLYWDVPELPVKTLAAVIGSAARVRQLATPGPLLGACDVCGAEVRATSRSHLDRRFARCKPCEPKPRYDWGASAGDDWYPDAADREEPPEWWEVLDDCDNDELDPRG